MAITATGFIQRINDKVNDIIHCVDNRAISIILEHLSFLPLECKLTLDSWKNRKIQFENKKQNGGKSVPHPVQVKRGSIYNADITTGIGSELKGNHLVIIMQNKNGNIFAEKVNVIIIEGDGKNINPKYQVQLSNDDLVNGCLDKNPSRIIPTEILTIDKARIKNCIGEIQPDKMEEIDMKVINQLGFEKYCKKS